MAGATCCPNKALEQRRRTVIPGLRAPSATNPCDSGWGWPPKTQSMPQGRVQDEMRRPAKPQQRAFELMRLMSARFPTAANKYPPTQNSRTPRFEAASPEAAGPRAYACIAAWGPGLVARGLFCKPLDLDPPVGKRRPTSVAVVDRTSACTRKRQQPLICKPDPGNPVQ
jgi:hypothetical protein